MFQAREADRLPKSARKDKGCEQMLFREKLEVRKCDFLHSDIKFNILENENVVKNECFIIRFVLHSNRASHFRGLCQNAKC